MASKNEVLVRRRIGEVQLTEEQFSVEQRELFKNILSVVDRNPVVEWKKDDPNHNQDFCLIEGKLEPVKSFAMKAAYIAGVSVESHDRPEIQPVPATREGEDGDVLVTVTVTASRGDRSVTMTGGSSRREVDRYGKNSRWLHDAVARAQTRAFKVAVENLLGFAFVNMVIQAVFGGFEVSRPEDEGARNVSPERKDVRHKPDPDSVPHGNKKVGARIWRKLQQAVKDGIMDETEKSRLWMRVQMNLDRHDVLVRIEEDVKLACEPTGRPQWG